MTTKVYRKPTAIRMTRYEAKENGDDGSIFMLLRPTGYCIDGWTSGTGRKVSSTIKRRAKRVLKEMMPELFPGRRKTRTRRRTSRAPKKRRRRTSRRVG